MSATRQASDYYTVLGVSPDASSDDIRAAFHRFARRHHPDRFVQAEADEQARQAERYRLGTEAYRVLLDPVRRPLYDEGLNQGRVRYTEDRTRARRRTMRPGGGVLVRSAKARTFSAKARSSIASQDWSQAKLNLQLALHAEPSNIELQTLLSDVIDKMNKA